MDPCPSVAVFATTRWTLVLRAGDGESPQHLDALNQLCGLYWYPLGAFARRQGAPPPDAQDLTQGFFARLLEGNCPDQADPRRIPRAKPIGTAAIPMKTTSWKSLVSLTVASVGLASFNVSAATLYVSLESTNPVPPFATWATAATNIQDAVDAAKDGDTVLVTNGVYAVGSRGSPESPVYDLSRVAVTNSIRLESVNGPLAATIDGGWDQTHWESGMRCVYLGANAVIRGFTLTNGNAHLGGGASGGSLYNCNLTDNVSDYGGGAWQSTLYNCTLTGNWSYHGGGADGCTLYHCTLTGNKALSSMNPRTGSGGGASFSTLFNCVLTGNSADWSGGGATRSTLHNCTLTGNSAGYAGGGASGGTLNNSIVFGNMNGNYYGEGSVLNGIVLNSCLTTPLPTNGIGNIDADPKFVDPANGNYRLRPDSPCIDTGTNLLSLNPTDITGEVRPWDGNKDGVAAFDIGAYEFRPSPVTLYVSLESTNPIPPYVTWETAANVIQDAVDAARAGDTVLVTNGVYHLGARRTFDGDGGSLGLNRVVVTNAIRLESVNGPRVTRIEGSTTVTNDVGVVIQEGSRCVYVGNGSVLSGFTLTKGRGTWGWYGGGGARCEVLGVMTNCVITGNTLGFGGGGGVAGGTLYNCILNGNGGDNLRAWVTGGGAAFATLFNCTLTDNWAHWNGGGAYACTLYSCTLTGNRADDGGGAFESTLYNCTLTGNEAWTTGGGAVGGTLNNCLLTGNSASAGGGMSGGTLNNCIVYFNMGGSGTANYYPDPDHPLVLNYCCTTPLPTNGLGNITADPMFVDLTKGNFRLQPGSPCIDAGTNLLGMAFTYPTWAFDSDTGEQIMALGHITDPTDILGNTRFIDGNGDGKVAWDIGVYEFNSFKPPRFAPQLRPSASGFQFTVTGEAGRSVRVERSRDLIRWESVATVPIPASGQTLIDPVATTEPFLFYRAVSVP